MLASRRMTAGRLAGRTGSSVRSAYRRGLLSGSRQIHRYMIHHQMLSKAQFRQIIKRNNIRYRLVDKWVCDG